MVVVRTVTASVTALKMSRQSKRQSSHDDSVLNDYAKIQEIISSSKDSVALRRLISGKDRNNKQRPHSYAGENVENGDTPGDTIPENEATVLRMHGRRKRSQRPRSMYGRIPNTDNPGISPALSADGDEKDAPPSIARPVKRESNRPTVSRTLPPLVEPEMIEEASLCGTSLTTPIECKGGQGETSEFVLNPCMKVSLYGCLESLVLPLTRSMRSCDTSLSKLV